MKIIIFRFVAMGLFLGISMGCVGRSPKPQQSHLPFIILVKDISFKELIWNSEVISVEEARRKLRSNEDAIENKLTPDIDPYKGYNPIDPKCRKENLPTKLWREDETQLTFVQEFYTSREKILASCINPKTVLKTAFQILYCKGSGTLFTIRYFYPQTQSWLNQMLARCSNKKA
jgi:hypothetical protein